MNKKKYLRRSLVIIGIFSIILAIYFSFFHKSKCENYECFKESLNECKKVVFLSEQKDGSWYYTIKGGEKNNYCLVNVKLLQVKEGAIGMEDLKGYEMECLIEKSSTIYPQNYLTNCHGRLKEEFLQKIIDKIHTNFIQNIGSLADALNQTK